MNISTRRVDKATILEMSGDIDMSNAVEVRKALLREIREKDVSRVVLNLRGVKYIDSSGVTSLLEGLKASRESGTRFVLCGLNDSAREVLKIAQLAKLFEVYDDEEQAVTS